MSLEIIPIGNEHLEDAAKLVGIRYKRLLEQMPSLPARYADANTLMPLLKKIVEAGVGVVALEGGEFKGFLAAWLLPSFRGSRSVFSPEWANAVLPNGRHVYEAMYTHLASVWEAEDYLAHLISLLSNDRDGIECWQWLGFGMLAADAVRDLQPVSDGRCKVDIRLASLNDIDAVITLADAMRRHTAGSPTFLVEDRKLQRAHYEEWLRSPGKAIWLAYQGTRAMAFLKIGSANDNACTVIRDEKTASITGAFTREDMRGEGVATSLLDRSLEWAHAQGYARCAVDFEPMNYWARRFWLRHFQPVCYSFIRHIDKRAVDDQET